MEQDLKHQYNKLIGRWKKYIEFVEDNTISMAEKLKWVPQAQKLTNEMSAILDKFKAENIEYTEVEVFEGFK